MTPDHAYWPGQTPRHPEGHFDAIRATVSPEMSPQVLAESLAFQTGLRWIDEGFYWEAHEVLEPVWLCLPLGSPERLWVQALIQLANARLKSAMGQTRAAARICALIRGLVADLEPRLLMGVNRTWIESRMPKSG